jgi:phosphohistidine phosphatase
MNMLHLLRHAKSSTKENVEDYERPLSRGGRKTARRVGRNLPAKLGAIDLVLCSSARRTRETLDLVLDEFSPAPHTSIEDGLYLSSREKLRARLCRLDPSNVNVLLIGHNPGLHELAIALADENSPAFRALASGKFPTAACVSFRVPADWSVLGSSRHELLGYVTPESLTDEDR